MEHEATDTDLQALAQGDFTPGASSASVTQHPVENPKPRKKGRLPLAQSPMGAPPTPALTAGSRTPSEVSAEPEAKKDTDLERQRRLIAQCKPALNRKFPNLCQHEWLHWEITAIYNKHNLGSVPTFAATTFGKTRFPKWADHVDGNFQPSLAEMLAYFGCREVLSHTAHDRFRCVVAEQHVVEKINALLARPKLDPEEMKALRWAELPFNVVNGDANVDLSAREAPSQPLSTPNEPVEYFQANGAITGPIQIMKREAPGDQAFCDGLPPAKRPRTAEDDAQAFLATFQEEARNVICDGLETLQENLNEVNTKTESEVVKVVDQALDTLAKDIPSKLDSSLEIFGHNLKHEVVIQIQETVKSGIQEALSNRESAIEEQIAGRLAKLEETIREELRNLPIKDAQTQGYPVYCMPSVPLQMPQIANMGGMGQQMIQGPALGGYIQPAPSPRNMKLNRDSQPGAFPSRRSN